MSEYTLYASYFVSFEAGLATRSASLGYRMCAVAGAGPKRLAPGDACWCTCTRTVLLRAVLPRRLVFLREARSSGGTALLLSDTVSRCLIIVLYDAEPRRARYAVRCIDPLQPLHQL